MNKLILSSLLLITLHSAGWTQDVKKHTAPPAQTPVKEDVKKDSITAAHANQDNKKDTIPSTSAQLRQEKRFYNPKQFVHETYLFVKNPITWNGYDWLKLGGVLGVTAALMPADNIFGKMTANNAKYYYSVPIVAGRVYGEWYSIGIVTVSFASYGLLAHDTTSKKIAVELFQAGVYSEGITALLKYTIGRARPYVGQGPFTFHPFSFFYYPYNSMPSGHMTSAIALSTILSRHAKKPFWKVMAYVPAAFTMVSRIYQGQHFFSDEFFGSCIGFFVGTWVMSLHEKKKHRINVPSNNPRLSGL